jgi:hypothetical protein
MKNWAKLSLLAVLMLMVCAGCNTGGSPEPTLSAQEGTHVALTRRAVDVQQTLTIQAQQGMFTPILAITNSPTPIPVYDASPAATATVIITLTQTPTPSAIATTPQVVAAPTTAALTALAPSLAAQALTLKDTLYLEVDQAQTRQTAGLFRPGEDYFLVLLGAFVNTGDERECIYSRQIRLGFEGDRFEPYVEAMASVRDDYDVDYPGPFGGQCVDANARSPTFILFDVPARMTNFAFLYSGDRIGGVLLQPNGDGSFRVEVQP